MTPVPPGATADVAADDPEPEYPESRSENKGSEPEGREVGRYRTALFVAVERADVVAVHQMVHGRPRFRQLLPTGMF